MKKESKVFLIGVTLASGVGYGLRRWFSKAKENEGEAENNNATEDSYRYRRLECYYDMLTKWMEIRLSDRSIAEYLKEQGIHKVAIYGHGKIGLLLYQDLVKDGIKVECFVDGQLQPDYQSIDNTLVTVVDRVPYAPQTDAMIITPSYDFEDIEKAIKKKGYKGIMLSLSQLLYQV